jgi:hypothetical protein
MGGRGCVSVLCVKRTSVESMKGDERAGKRGWSVWCWVLAFAFVLYPLSIGPVVRLADESVISHEVPWTLYTPIRFMVYRWPLARRFFNWYVFDLWGAKD